MNDWAQLRTEERDGGVVFPLRAKPRGGANAILGVREGALLVAVTAAPEAGKANASIIALLAKTLGIARSTVEIRRGETSRDKIIFVCELSAEALVARLRFVASKVETLIP